MPEIRELMNSIKEDSWRQSKGFSADIEAIHRQLFSSDNPPVNAEEILAGWLKNGQPCFFGRIAVVQDLLSYCILTESDLLRPDDEIRDLIQKARLRWHQDAYAGSKSGFIVWVISKRLAWAEPNPDLQALATRLCSLYLLDEVVTDEVFLDELFLEADGVARTTWRWDAGVNFFGAAGDGRWWHDHRIPGGIAFSVNSVGHMVKACQLTAAVAAYEEALGLDTSDRVDVKLPNLDAALVLAMKTIDKAAEAVSGKATRLTARPDTERPAKVTLPQKLQEMSTDEYIGYYHTDHTVPSVYFRPDVERPSEVTGRVLDFTYLHRSSADNPAHITMGSGLRVRVDEDDPTKPTTSFERLSKSAPALLSVDDCPDWVKEMAGQRPA
jgi:hypothetical protein